MPDGRGSYLGKKERGFMTGEDQLNEKELQQVAGGVYIQQLKRVFCVTCQKDVSPHEEFECATRMHTLEYTNE